MGPMGSMGLIRKKRRIISTIPALVALCVLSGGCDPMFEFVRGADWAAKHAVERYLDADKSGEPIQDFWCRPDKAKRRFFGPMSFEVVMSHKEETSGKNRDAAWFAFQVTTRAPTEKAYSGYITERYVAYVKKMPEGSYKLFGLVKESEAQEWEFMKSRMEANEEACAFPR